MAPLCRHPYCRTRRCRRCSCSCGGGMLLHKQAARAKVARSSAQPEGLRSASRRQSRRSCSASQRTPPHTGATHRQARGRGSMRRLAPSSGSPQAVCLRSYGCLLRSHPPHRSKSAAVARAPSAVFPRAPQAPSGLAPQGARRTKRPDRLPKSATARYNRLIGDKNTTPSGSRGAGAARQ